MVRIIAQAWVTVNMAGQGELDQLVEMKMKIIENQNDSGMQPLDCSIPRGISDKYDEGFLKHRRSDPYSVAYFARAIDVIEPDSSSSEDDFAAGGADSPSAASASHRAANTQQPWRDHEKALGGRARDNEDTDVCYVCQEPGTPTNVLVGACRCSLKAHQSCHWA